MGNVNLKKRLIDLLIAGALVLLCASGPIGCSLIPSPKQPDFSDMTKEQIEAFERAGIKVYSCFQLAGPPPAGSTSILTMPKDSQANIKFSDTCRPQFQ